MNMLHYNTLSIIARSLYFLIISALVVSSCSDDDPPSSCSDGVLNGTEVGIDCGGDTCPTCDIRGCIDPEAHNYNAAATLDDGSCETCFDGIQNGDEVGVDCGGMCQDCPNESELIVGVWRQLTHIEDGVDARDFYEIENVFYHFESTLMFDGLTVQRMGATKTPYQGSYTIDEIGNIISRRIDQSVIDFAFEFDNDLLRLTNTSISGGIEVQTFERVDVDLCDGVRCVAQICSYGYCL